MEGYKERGDHQQELRYWEINIGRTEYIATLGKTKGF
jgi:hypothetical protein